MTLWQRLRDTLRQRPVPRRRRTPKYVHVQNLHAAIMRGERRLSEMHRQAPGNPACCASCWLYACMPGYRDLTDKQDRRRATYHALTGRWP